MTTTSRTVQIVKRSYSRGPWRLVDSATGLEVAFEPWTVRPADGEPVRLHKPGYRTKAEATEALGRLAARLLDAYEAGEVRL